MDMSFTQDPDWIEQREALWEQHRENWEEELSKKQIKDLHRYFMTGELFPGAPKFIVERIYFFPKVNIEGIQHVMKHNMPEGATEKDVEALNLFFSDPTEIVPGMSTEEGLDIFRYVFGDRYNRDWELPFLINDETIYRQSALDPNYQFSCFVDIKVWLKREGRPRNMWYQLKDYWFSLLNDVDPILFRKNDRNRRPPNVNIKILPRQFRAFLGFCAHEIDISEGASWGEERRQYMKDFNERMNNLDGPEELLTLWHEVKQADREEFDVVG